MRIGVGCGIVDDVGDRVVGIRIGGVGVGDVAISGVGVIGVGAGVYGVGVDAGVDIGIDGVGVVGGSIFSSGAPFDFFFYFYHHFHSPAQLVGFTLSDLLDKPWSQVSSLLPPGTCLQFLSRIGFSIPTARRLSSNITSSRSSAFR